MHECSLQQYLARPIASKRTSTYYATYSAHLFADRSPPGKEVRSMSTTLLTPGHRHARSGEDHPRPLLFSIAISSRPTTVGITTSRERRHSCVGAEGTHANTLSSRAIQTTSNVPKGTKSELYRRAMTQQ